MEKFKLQLIDILEVEEINENDILRDFDEWDSLTVLSIIAAVDSEFGVKLDASDIDNITTIAELFEFIQKNK